MNPFNDKEMRDFLRSWEVPEPSPALVNRSKNLMHEEMIRLSTAPSRQVVSVFMLVGLALLMSLSLFYMFTVGTILRFLLPPYLLIVVRYSLFAFIAAGGSMVVGTLMVIYFKHFHTSWVVVPERI